MGKQDGPSKAVLRLLEYAKTRPDGFPPGAWPLNMARLTVDRAVKAGLIARLRPADSQYPRYFLTDAGKAALTASTLPDKEGN